MWFIPEVRVVTYLKFVCFWVEIKQWVISVSVAILVYAYSACDTYTIKQHNISIKHIQLKWYQIKNFNYIQVTNFFCINAQVMPPQSTFCPVCRVVVHEKDLRFLEETVEWTMYMIVHRASVRVLNKRMYRITFGMKWQKIDTGSYQAVINSTDIADKLGLMRQGV